MLTWFAISGILILVAASAMALILLAQRETFVHTLWGAFCVLVAFWGIAAYNIGSTQDPQTALLWWKIGYIGVTFIPTMFTHFVYVFLGYRSRWLIVPLYILSGIYLLANAYTDLFMAGVHEMFGSLYFMTPTLLYNTYMLMWIVLIPYAHVLLYREYLKVTGQRKEQIRLFFLGSFIGFFGGSFSFLPEYNISIYPLPNIAVCLYPPIMGYAILKYGLWNFKVAVTQASVLLLWIFIAARVILSPFGSQDQIIESVLLMLTVVVGTLLIRSVNKEVRQRQLIEAQEQELEKVNKQQEGLLHFISHEIKGYLTKNEAAFAAIATGDFGPVTAPVRKISQSALTDTRKGVATVMDILDASNLKKGTVAYNKSDFDLGKALAEIVNDLQQSAKDKGLALTIAHVDECMINGDEDKIRRHVLRNVIDNSIKYTLTGSVKVALDKVGDAARITVADTGVGITPQDMQRLFTEGGHGTDSIKVNVHSTGYGLYIAKQIVDAHGGSIRAESEGTGKGSRFIIEFPFAK
jgi:signal transduction histidine kinase